MSSNKKQRNTTLLILSLIAGLVYLTPFLRFSFYDQMREALGLSDSQMGVIGAVYGAVNIFAYIPSGFMAERFNTKKLLMISTFGMFISTVWYSFFPGFTSILIIHALFGVFSVGTFWSAYLMAVRSLAPENEQGTIFGISESLRGIGQTAIAFLSLWALGMFSSPSSGFRTVLYINAAAFGILFLAVKFSVPDFNTVQSKDESLFTTIKNMIYELKHPSVWICIFVIMCGYTLWNTINGYIGTYCTRVLHISEELSSILSIVRSYIVVFIAGISGGVALDKFKTKGDGLMVCYALCIVLSFGILLFEKTVAICLILTVLAAYFVNVIKSTYWSVMGDAGISEEATARATGIISLIALSPDFFVPPVISSFISYGEKIGDISKGFNIMLYWMVLWAALGVPACLILKRRKEKSTADNI